MTFWEIWAAIGGSTLVASLFSLMIHIVYNKISVTAKKNKYDNENQRLALQAILRHDLRVSYKFFIKQGWIDIADKEDFDNMYNRYHNLGKNGVMDSMHAEIMALPTSRNSK